MHSFATMKTAETGGGRSPEQHSLREMRVTIEEAIRGGEGTGADQAQARKQRADFLEM